MGECDVDQRYLQVGCFRGGGGVFGARRTIAKKTNPKVVG